MRLSAAVLLLVCACDLPVPPAGGSGGGAATDGGDAGATGGGSVGGGAGGETGGGTGGGSTSDYDGGSTGWQWLPIAGSKCGSGSTAGIGLKESSLKEDLFIFVQGGGACWNTGTCVPSFVQFGPVCEYGQVCLADVQGGTQPTAVHVREADPYPADGGGAFPSEVGTLEASVLLARDRVDNPFRAASFVYVPYCTGDLHAGDAEQRYQYRTDLIGPEATYTMHFAGATNMELYLATLKQRFPNAKRVWLTGVSGGGYGATLNFDRVARAFPNAEVHLLADSAPLVPSNHWAQWSQAWNIQLPQGCTDCDAGLPQTIDHLIDTWPNRRIGLLSYDEDKVISWFFYAPPGAGGLLNPPVGTFKTNLGQVEARYDLSTQARYFVVGGDSHVLLGNAGVRLTDGGFSPPMKSRDGGTDLLEFVEGWATGGTGYRSSR